MIHLKHGASPPVVSGKSSTQCAEELQAKNITMGWLYNYLTLKFMNDRFKFKCWDKNKKTWLNDSIVGLQLNGLIIAPEETYLQHNPADLVLLQSSGLKDKDGKLIFEGDILEVRTKVFQVKFGEYDVGEFEDKLSGIGWYLVNNVNIFNIYGWDENNWEIIGNIYENPELLE